jgi:hypothetical protein
MAVGAEATDYVWFDQAEVVRSELGFTPECLVNGKRVPLPVAILHRECRLEKVGDKGTLGVPTWWAVQHGLICEA